MDSRTRSPGTNDFVKDGERGNVDLGNVDKYDSNSFVRNGLCCSYKLFPLWRARKNTSSLNGIWFTTLFPIPWVYSLLCEKAMSEDKLCEAGIAVFCFYLPCPFCHERHRIIGTNRFVASNSFNVCSNDIISFDSMLCNVGLTDDHQNGQLTFRICCAP